MFHKLSYAIHQMEIQLWSKAYRTDLVRNFFFFLDALQLSYVCCCTADNVESDLRILQLATPPSFTDTVRIAFVAGSLTQEETFKFLQRSQVMNRVEHVSETHVNWTLARSSFSKALTLHLIDCKFLTFHPIIQSTSWNITFFVQLSSSHVVLIYPVSPHGLVDWII